MMAGYLTAAAISPLAAATAGKHMLLQAATIKLVGDNDNEPASDKKKNM